MGFNLSGFKCSYSGRISADGLQKYGSGGAIDRRFKIKIDKWFDNIFSEALKKEPPPKLNANNGKPSKTESRNLLEFFQKHRAEVLAFAFDKSMPFSNNLAEQSFRHVKTKTVRRFGESYWWIPPH
jgi:hypothetical protein